MRLSTVISSLLSCVFLLSPITTQAQALESEVGSAQVQSDPSVGNLVDADLDNWYLHSPHYDDIIEKKFQFAEEVQIDFSHNGGNTNQFSIGGDNEFAIGYATFINVLQFGISYSQSSFAIGTPLHEVRRHLYVDEQFEFHWHKRYYSLVSFDWHTDRPTGIEHYYSGNIGLGAYIADSPKLIFRVEADYHYSNEDLIDPYLSASIHSLSSRLYMIWDISGSTEWSNELEAIFPISDLNNNRLDFESNLQFEIVKPVFFSFAFHLRFDNEPITGFRKYDTDTTASIGVEF